MITFRIDVEPEIGAQRLPRLPDTDISSPMYRTTRMSIVIHLA
jgi:hypothetical protein